MKKTIETRPWGSYEVLLEEELYKVKRIIVHPNMQLSLQLHHERSEHWIVVGGKAKAIKGNEEHVLSINDSIYIPVGTMHRIKNIGEVNLIFIEVQSGSYFGEDDIVRFEDDFGRK